MATYLDYAKPDTFLAKYMRWNEPLETPRAYDFWCGLWLLSCAIGRRLIVRRPHAPVYLNLYAVLCSDAGITRKSTAVRRAEMVYRAADFTTDYHTVTSSTSPERLFSSLADQSERTGVGGGALIVSELITILGREQYSMGLPGLLTDLYDAPSIRTRHRTSSGDVVINNAFLTLLGASTPAWLVRAINPDVIEGGFTSRCLFIIEERPKRRVAWPDETDTNSDHVANMVSDLAAIRADAERYREEAVTLTDAALSRFRRWYDGRSEGTGLFLSSFHAREDHHILRLAALLCINERLYQIQVRHIDAAIAVAATVRDRAAALFGDGGSTRRLIAGVDKLRDALASGGLAGVTKSDLIFKTRNHLKTAELDFALTAMHDLGMVTRYDVQGKRGAPATIWRATNTILQRQAVVILNERMEQ